MDNLDNLDPEERKGINGRSVFLDMSPSFDIVRDMPTEYLHSTCLGVIKRLVSLTFAVTSDVRHRVTKRKLSKPDKFNELMSKVKTPRESSRRARDLDFSVLKGAEFRNLALFFFPLILECIEEGEGERKLWLYMAYMIRACILPSDEFRYVELKDVNDCCSKYYHQYEKLFSKLNCSYNTHVVLSHLVEMRSHGPLTMTSAFPFESFYGEMRHAFVPRTVSPLKQILKKILLKRVLTPHCCELPIFYSNHTTALEDNTLIYCWQHNDHNIYVIQEIIDDDNFMCFKMGKSHVTFKETKELKWNRVGVYQKGELGNEPFMIKRIDISGKVIEVLNYLITYPNNVLREK